MKRSEIFNKIANILKRDLSVTKSLLLANEILESIENSGMLPSKIIRNLTEHEVNDLNRTKGINASIDVLVARHEWEIKE